LRKDIPHQCAAVEINGNRFFRQMPHLHNQ
jgi:hypothetical protein